MKDCYDYEKRDFKCELCVFAEKNSQTCANPMIWKTPAMDPYFKTKEDVLTEEEINSIDRIFGINE